MNRPTLKRTWMMLWASFIAITSMAQVTTVQVTETGTLWDVLENQGVDISTVTDLKVTGPIDYTDFRFMRSMLPALVSVDLAGAEFSEVPNDAFREVANLRSCRLPINIERVGDAAFFHCDALENLAFGQAAFETGVIVFPASLTSMGGSVFEHCLQLTSVDFSHCTDLGIEGFYQCSKLKEVALPSIGNIRLGGNCFLETAIEQLTLTPAVNWLEYNSIPFTLRTLIVESKTAYNCSLNAFDSVDKSKLQIWVPQGTIRRFALADGWFNVNNLIKEYNVRVAITGEGSLLDNTTVLSDGNVFLHSNQTTLTAQTAEGYTLQSASFNGDALSINGNLITLPATPSEGTLSVTFVPQAYTLNIQVTGNGVVYHNGEAVGTSITLLHGEDATFTLQPAEGLSVQSILWNGEESVIQNGGLTYKTPSMTGDASLAVVFGDVSTSDKVQMTVTSDEGGSVQYKGITLDANATILVGKNETAVFTFVPNTGMRLDKVLLNGTDVTSQVNALNLIVSGLTAEAQLSVSFTSGTIYVVDNPDGGAIFDQIKGFGGNPRDVTHLTVNGTMNQTDWTIIKNVMNKLEEIDLTGTNITEVPEQAFAGKTSLKTVKLPLTTIAFRIQAFSNSSIEIIEGCSNIKEIETNCFENSKLKSLPFGEQLTGLNGDWIFGGCMSLPEKVVMPASLRGLGSRPFTGTPVHTLDLSRCTVLESLGWLAAENITTLTLPESGSCRLEGQSLLNSGIRELTIPTSITYIGGQVMPSTLERLYVHSVTPIDAEANAFSDVKLDECILYVPSGSAKDYQVATGWASFLNIEEFGIQLTIHGGGTVKYKTQTLSNGDAVYPIPGIATSIQFVPKIGYELGTVTLNGTPVTVGNDGTYIIDAALLTGIVDVTFSSKSLNVGLEIQGNGTVSLDNLTYHNSATLNIDGGKALQLTLMPDGENFVKQIVLNGEEKPVLNGGTSYTTPVLADDTQIKVVFADNSEVSSVANITLSQTGYGSVNYRGVILESGDRITVIKDQDVTFNFVYDGDSNIEALSVNDEDVTAQVSDKAYTIRRISDDIILNVSFFSTTRLVVDNPNGGKLNDAIVAQGGNARTVTILKVNGTLNQTDWTIIKNLMNNLEEVDLSGTDIVTIPDQAFYGKDKLKIVKLPVTATQINGEAFADCSTLTTITGCDNIKYIGGSSFRNCSQLVNFPFGDDLMRIEAWNAFENCLSLPKKVTLPASLTYFGHGAFNYPGIETVDFSACSNLERIEHSSVGSAKTVILPETGSYALGGEAFRWAQFMELILPANVNRIDGSVMPSTLKRLYVKATTPIDADQNAFSDVDVEKCILFVPAGCTTDYQLTPGWNNFLNVQEAGFNVSITGRGHLLVNEQSYADKEVFMPVFGTETTFQVVPSPGYEIVSVKFNGQTITLTDDNTYTVDASILKGQVEVQFASIDLAVTLDIQGLGSCTVDGQVYRSGTTLSIDGGTALELALASDEGNFVKQILLNGEDMPVLNGGLSFTTPVLTENTQITIVFANNSEASSMANITLTQAGYGSVSYRGVMVENGDRITISKGQNAMFVFNIESGARITALLMNEEDVTNQVNGNTYTLENILGDIALDVTFFSPTHLVVDNPNGGELNDIIVAQGCNARQVTVLKVNGKLTSKDWNIIKNLMNNLEEIDLTGTNITEVPEQAFAGKTSLKTVKLPLTTIAFRTQAFSNSSIEIIEGCSNIREIETNCFENAKLKSLPFGEQLMGLNGDWIFGGCMSLPEKVVMPASLRGLGSRPFTGTPVHTLDLSRCTVLESLGWLAAENITTLTLPESGSCRLEGQSLLSSGIIEMTIPTSITYIGGQVMPSTLKRLYVQSLSPIEADQSAFDEVNMDECVLYVPRGTSADYQLARGWLKFTNVQESGLRVKVGSEGKVVVNDHVIIGEDVLFVKDNETATMQIIPQVGWHVSEVKLNGIPLTFEKDQISLNGEQANGTLSISFAINTYDLAIQILGDGQVFLGEDLMANGQVLAVDSASVKTFTLQPAAGKAVTQITFNGEETLVQNGGTTYVTPAITRASALQVTFAESGEQGDYVVYNIVTGNNGTVEYKSTTLLPETSIQVPKGENAVFTFRPSPNYIVQSLILNGEDITDQLVDNKLTISDVNTAVQMEVTFQVEADITIAMENEGLLYKMINEEARQKVTKLTISGPLNDADFRFIRDELPLLSVLDLWNADCTQIPDNAFCISEEWDNETGKTTLTQVRLPEGIYRIGYRAFAGCTNLTEVNFEDLTNLNDISGWAFTNTGIRRADLSNTRITDLGDAQFRKARKMEYVVLPSTLTNINNAFQENSSLTEIDLSNCISLINIGDAFGGDKKLERVVLPEGMKSLNNTFSDCTALTSVNFPKSLEVIGDGTFYNTKLTSADMKACANLLRIGNGAFNNCKQLSNVTFPNSIQRIGDTAFHECDALTAIDMSQLSLAVIEGSLFCWCDNLESVKLPKTVVTIRGNAFRGTKLSGILELPASLTTIENDAFSSTQITVVKVAATNPPILATENEDGENVFSNTLAAAFVPEGCANKYKETPGWQDLTILDKEVQAEVTVTREGNLAIDIMEQTGVAPGLITHLKVHGSLNATDFAVMRSNMTLLYDLDLEDANISVIPENAFLDKKILMNVKLPASLLVIQDNAFKGCSALSGTLTLPSGVTTIGWAAFQGCTSLNRIVFNDALEVIRGYAFEGCNNLTQEITFPDKFLSLGEYAFANCRNLFGKVRFNSDFYMFIGAEGYWSETGRAFENCSGIEEVDLSECEYLYEIPSATFNECSSLTIVKLPPYLERIDDHTFMNCRSLTTIDFPSSLLVINYNAFNGCFSLRRLDLSNCEEFGAIEGYAFSGCSSLETVNLPKSLNWIHEYAFNECRKLANLNVEALEPATLGEYVFRRVNTEKCVLSIPTGVYYDYLTAAQWGAFVQMRNAIDITLDEGATLSYSSNASIDDYGSSMSRTRRHAPRRAASTNQTGEAVVKDGTSLYVSDDESVTFFITPDENVSIKQVLFNGEDVTDQIIGNAYETPNVTEASSFKVLLNIDGDITVKELRMTETEVAIKVAESHQIAATVYPNNATNKNIIWTSSDENVASVSANGIVEGVSAGRANITARTEDGDFTQTCQIIVMSNDYYIKLNDAETFVDNLIQVPLMLHNADDAKSIQFDVYMSEGIAMDNESNGDFGVCMSDRSNGHTVSASRRSDGSVRVIIYSNDGNSFYNNDGELLSLPITTRDQAGEFELAVKNIHITGPKSFDFTAPDYTVTIKVSDYPLGDSNGNGEVTITDVANTVEEILEHVPERFIRKAADANKDGIITVSDVTATVGIVLGWDDAAGSRTKAPYAIVQPQGFGIDRVTMTAGEKQTVAMRLTNTSCFTALQCDIFLPEGFTLNPKEIKSSSPVHFVSADKVTSGAVRILMVSMDNDEMPETADGLLNLPIQAAEDVMPGNYPLDIRNIRFVANDGITEMMVPDVMSQVVVVDPTTIDEQFMAGSPKVHVEGHHLYLEAKEAKTMRLVSANGVVRVLHLQPGQNRIFVEVSGVYMLEGRKIVIK